MRRQLSNACLVEENSPRWTIFSSNCPGLQIIDWTSPLRRRPTCSSHAALARIRSHHSPRDQLCRGHPGKHHELPTSFRPPPTQLTLRSCTILRGIGRRLTGCKSEMTKLAKRANNLTFGSGFGMKIFLDEVDEKKAPSSSQFGSNRVATPHECLFHRVHQYIEREL